MDWLEYIYWINWRRPEDYRANLPDTNVWIKDYGIGMDTSYNSIDLKYSYLRHPKYQNYPVVGISQELVEQYASWRADRVFEQHLVSIGVLEVDPRLASTNHFTIDRFFRGEYATLKPIDTIRYYPHYRLPTPEEYLAAAAYRDSMLGAHRSWCLTKRCKECLEYSSEDNPLITEPPTHGMVTFPRPGTHGQCWRYHRKMIMNIRGNVDELTSVPGITTREVFRGNGETPDTVIHRDVNSYTGSRNVMTWRLWVDH